MIRALQAITDRAAVTDLFRRAADHAVLETGSTPGQTQIEDFFTAAPPGVDPATSLRLGLSLTGTDLVAIAGVAIGYPRSDDAYIGLLLIDPAHRSKRLGQHLLDHICAATKAKGATRLLIAVLEENVKGHRFWSKMGFTDEMRGALKQIGAKTHVQIRMTRPL